LLDHEVMRSALDAVRPARTIKRGRTGLPKRGGPFFLFKFSTDPELEAKIRDVVGLYLDPPDKAIMLCLDKKSQIQALDRTAPVLPLRLWRE
jgi:hypothetical protein